MGDGARRGAAPARDLGVPRPGEHRFDDRALRLPQRGAQKLAHLGHLEENHLVGADAKANRLDPPSLAAIAAPHATEAGPRAGPASSAADAADASCDRRLLTRPARRTKRSIVPWSARAR